MIKANPATVQIVRCSRTRLCDHRLGPGQSGLPSSAPRTGLMSALLRTITHHPVLVFMVIGLGAGFLTAAQVGRLRMPRSCLRPATTRSLGRGCSAWVSAQFLVTGALAGRDGVVDLARRSVRWRVPVRWYLVALFTVPVGATPI
jgi:hypothetical protein